jgi:hypothetical protein
MLTLSIMMANIMQGVDNSILNVGCPGSVGGEGGGGALAILAGSASIAAAYRRSINRPAMTPPTLSGNARCTRSARHPHPSCEAKQLGRGALTNLAQPDAAAKSP